MCEANVFQLHYCRRLSPSKRVQRNKCCTFPDHKTWINLVEASKCRYCCLLLSVYPVKIKLMNTSTITIKWCTSASLCTSNLLVFSQIILQLVFIWGNSLGSTDTDMYMSWLEPCIDTAFPCVPQQSQTTNKSSIDLTRPEQIYEQKCECCFKLMQFSWESKTFQWNWRLRFVLQCIRIPSESTTTTPRYRWGTVLL